MKKIVSGLFITSATLGLGISIAQADDVCTRQPQSAGSCKTSFSAPASNSGKVEQYEQKVSQAQSELKNAHATGDRNQIKEKQDKLRKAQYELSEVMAFF